MKSRLYLLKINLFFFIAVLPLLGFGEVEYTHQRDVVYGYKDGMGLIMDIYTPKAELNKAGVIVVIAGGMKSDPVKAHQAGKRADIQSLLKSGYIVFATTHSSQPKFTADEIRHDIPRAVRFIRFNADKFGVDPLRLGILGYSSGGQISLMAGLATAINNAESDDPVDKESSELQAVAAYYPGTDMVNFGMPNTTLLEHFHSVGSKIDAAFDYHEWDNTTKRFERVVDPEKQIEYYKKNSPITYVSKDNPPVLLIHGNQDKLVPIQQSEILVAELNKVGVPNKLVVVDGKGHGRFGDASENAFKEVLCWFEEFLLEK